MCFLSIMLLSFAGHAVVISNRPEIGVTIDNITKKTQVDWSCWETDPTPSLSIFEGSFCGVIKIAANSSTGEDGYVGVVRAYNTGLSAFGRYVVGLNNKDDLNWIYGVQVVYDNNAAGSYQLELIDDDWDYISITDQTAETCGKKGDVIGPNNCTMKGIIPFSSRAKYYKTAKNIYTRVVLFGSKKSSSSMILNQLEALVYWAGPR